MQDFMDSGWFTIVYAFIVVMSVITGYSIARKYYVKRNRKWTLSGVESSIISFFALILAFTFATAYDGYENRLSNIHAEADIVGTMQRQGKQMPVEIQGKVNGYLKEYLRLQIGFYSHQVKQDEWLNRGEKIQQDYFNYLMLIKNDTAVPAGFDLLEKNQNDLSIRFNNNFYALSERTPPLIMFLIVIASLLIGCLVGFTNGFYEKRHYLVPAIYVFMVVLTVQAIKDLDYPLGGFIKPDVSNLRNIFDRIN